MICEKHDRSGLPGRGCPECNSDTAESKSALSAGLSAELINAIEQMAVEINTAPDDNPCITMHPRIWLLWEDILFKANIGPDITGR